ncbi:MAG: four helix bundle protein [Lentisphaerae bacterium]|jgi:four helix bundle suffix protein|nr:four helix bundle protein [Lentisphaerota bacterium]
MSNVYSGYGGYQNLKSFKIAQLIYDVTVHFCNLYIDKFSRTRDQMTQAARSGVQNIAEGSLASVTSKKTEIMLTQVARASLEELKLDYSDFLRQHNLVLLRPDHPILLRFKQQKPTTIEEVLTWMANEHNSIEQNHGLNEQQKMSCIMANGVLALINLACYLLGRQIQRQINDFIQNGDFSERLSKLRAEKRKTQKK